MIKAESRHLAFGVIWIRENGTQFSRVKRKLVSIRALL